MVSGMTAMITQPIIPAVVSCALICGEAPMTKSSSGGGAFFGFFSSAASSGAGSGSTSGIGLLFFGVFLVFGIFLRPGSAVRRGQALHPGLPVRQAALADLDQLDQGILSRTDIRARPALGAVLYLERLQLLPHPGVRVRAHQVRYEVHGTPAHAPAAPDAGEMRRLVLEVSLPPQHDYARGALDDRDIDRVLRQAHHRAPDDDLSPLAHEATAIFDDVPDPGPQLHPQVRASRDAVAIHCQHPVDHRHAGREALVDLGRGADVVHHHADVQRQAAARHFLARDRLDEGLLGAGGVAARERYDLYVPRLARLAQRVDGVVPVVLDADHQLLGAHGLLDDEPALDDVQRFLDHQTVVAAQVGLALGAVEDDRRHRLVGRRVEFHVSGKGAAAKADYARLPDPRADLFGGERQRVIHRDQSLEGSVLLVGLDLYRSADAALGVRVLEDSLDLARDARVDRSGDVFRGVAYLLSAKNALPHLHDGLACGSHTLFQWDHHGFLGRAGEDLHGGGLLSGWRMNSVFHEEPMAHPLGPSHL